MAKLVKKVVKKYEGKVYDLTIEDTHSYNINGVSVHNSAAGCLLSWCLDIIKIDPLRFGLYFERFLNPTRNCLCDDSMVLLKDGSYKRIVDIKIGDPVKTESGEGELIGVFSRELTESDQVFEIETENGSILRLTGDHIVPVIRNKERIEIKVIDMLITDELIIL